MHQRSCLLHLLGTLLLTILPDWKIKAVVLGSRIRIITAAKRCRRYHAQLRAHR